MTSGLNQFIQSANETAAIKLQFDLVCSNANLVNPECGAIGDALNTDLATPGIYYWSMLVGESEYKIYVGKTNSLLRRIKDYLKEFQPHSPNDYKLRIFQQAAVKRYPNAKFSLRFFSANVANLTKLENDMVTLLDPLLNQRAKPPAQAKTALQHAFEAYYIAGFSTLLEQ
ncbi:GIY-YIG nuclease family protein [Ferribacterium limneticum]|uniref:GIY-YIG nuclease family protein n=1 Tax=Ferribacterium limneticum TaxID=76259 RepID=UPI001CF9BAC5|nr:GIY-YIG nuclease family protein [Ferribacterium limneticum]UCV28392.1 GIY-YIG nuclease family protein [Ferribacterium limneticum]UCV32309.1 GIY-YIG nuclease family protein [Ferribacterium limneticum]